MWETVRAQPVGGHYRLTVRRREGQPTPTAEPIVRTVTVAIQPPHDQKPRGLASVRLNVILVEERNPPPSVNPIVWLLLTTLPLNTERVQQCIKWYSDRWLIERYHFVYKSGRHLALQLETLGDLNPAVNSH